MLSNIKIENTRTVKNRHCMVRPFVGIHDRTWKDDGSPREVYLDQATPTSIPKKLWPIQRVRTRRSGQLELIRL